MGHSKKRITKVLIRLRRCAGWSAPVLFTNPRTLVFSGRGPYYVDTVARFWWACANVKTHQGLRCQHLRSLYLSYCPVTMLAHMGRLTRVYAAGVNSTQITIWGSTLDFGTVTKAKVTLCKCADLLESTLLARIAHKSSFEAAHWILTSVTPCLSTCT